MKKLYLCNLGCSKNLVDGDTIAGFLLKNSYELCDDSAEADTIVVNTCSFIEQATKEAIEAIWEHVGQKSEGCKLIVAGCFSQRYSQKVANDFEGVDLWLSVNDWRKELCKFLQIQDDTQGFVRILSEPKHSQYVKVADGCSHRCSFCVIPSIKGNFKSEPVEDILKEALWLQENGVKELILVAQDTTYYGKDIKTNIINLLKTLLDKTNFRWIRLMYLYPTFVSDEFLDFVAANPRICPYFDIPLQHISSDILKSMRRKGGSEDLYNLVSKIRDKVKNAVLRTSFIIGYPGETTKDFNELCEFVEWAKFDKMGVFPYSAEEGTTAAEMPKQVGAKTVGKRVNTIMEIQQNISSLLQEAKVGQKIEVIVDRISDFEEYNFECRTRGDAPEVDGKVHLLDGDAEPGDFLEVEIIDCDDYDLIAKFVRKIA